MFHEQEDWADPFECEITNYLKNENEVTIALRVNSITRQSGITKMAYICNKIKLPPIENNMAYAITIKLGRSDIVLLRSGEICVKGSVHINNNLVTNIYYGAGLSEDITKWCCEGKNAIEFRTEDYSNKNAKKTFMLS